MGPGSRDLVAANVNGVLRSVRFLRFLRFFRLRHLGYFGSLGSVFRVGKVFRFIGMLVSLGPSGFVTFKQMEQGARRPSRGELSYASVLQAREPVLVDLPDVLSKLWEIGARMQRWSWLAVRAACGY